MPDILTVQLLSLCSSHCPLSLNALPSAATLSESNLGGTIRLSRGLTERLFAHTPTGPTPTWLAQALFSERQRALDGLADESFFFDGLGLFFERIDVKGLGVTLVGDGVF